MTLKPAEITEVEIARGFWSRFRGWMGRKPLPGTALLIYPCSSVHTFFMQAAIDVVFLNSEGRVVKLVEGLKPWRVSPVVLSPSRFWRWRPGTRVNRGSGKGKASQPVG